MRVAVVGASGYTGAELVRLLLAHPRADLREVVGHSSVGQPLCDVVPSLAGLCDLALTDFDARRLAGEVDCAFLALPHGQSAEKAAALRAQGTIVFDLSADFRLRDHALYTRWYGREHAAPSLLSEAVYGLPELYAPELRKADLVAVPGCFPTAALLGLAPLIRQELVELDRPVLIDAKTGVSGAGRKVRASTHFPEVSGGIRAYSTAGRHRHTPEIEQELSALAGKEVRAVFNPHLVPMSRGILSVAYLFLREGVGDQQCADAARAAYAESPSVFVHPAGANPDTAWVRGSNRAHLSYTRDTHTNALVVQCAIDNLGKGAAGQAVQCFNLRGAFERDAGIRWAGAWP